MSLNSGSRRSRNQTRTDAFAGYEESQLSVDMYSSLATPEEHWRRRPLVRPREQDFRATLTRWSLVKPARPIEFESEATDGSHTITINRSVSAGRFLFGRKEITLSNVPVYSSLLVPPGTVTRIVFTDAAEAYRLYLSQALLAECHEHVFEACSNEDIVLSNVSFLNDRPLQYMIRALLEIGEEKIGVGHMIVESISLAIAARCVLLNSKKPEKKAVVGPLSKWRLRLVTEYVDAYLFEPIYLQDLAQIAGLTRMHFSRQFRLATGETPNAYVIRRKIEHAQQLLIDGSLCIADISAMLGFRSQSYFTMLFKRIIGETPARWRALSK